MRLAIALVHYPILDRAGGEVTSAITNVDLHDLARSARTYGATDVFIVHPVEAQRLLAERVREHWVDGSGKRRIPDRAPALDLLRVVPSLEDAYAALGGRENIEVWTTAASSRWGATTTFIEARQRLLASERPILGGGSGPARGPSAPTPPVILLFGTGWGLPERIIRAADVRIEPINAALDTAYNHLSVRAACAIALDRLLGAR